MEPGLDYFRSESQETRKRSGARLLGDAGVAATTAGKTGQVLVVENRFFASMSHHAVHLMRRLAEELYPENPEERGLPRLGSEHGANH